MGAQVRIKGSSDRQGCCCFSGPQVHEVFPDYEVVMLQPRTGTPTDLSSAANCYVAILIIPTLPFSARHPLSARGVYTLMPLPSLPFQLLYLQIGSFYHPGFTYLCPRIPRTIAPWIRLHYLSASPYLSTPDGFSIPFPCHHQMSSNAALSCFGSDVCCHHVLRCLPPTS